MARVQVYGTAHCGYCERAKQLLARKGVAFEELRVDLDPAAREAMLARSGRRTVPQVFIGDTHVGGYSELRALDLEGGLDALLGEADAPTTTGTEGRNHV
jgi:glutaredoxin 3